MEIEDHLENQCDKIMVKCEDCGQNDFRIAFKSGKHECLVLRDEESIEIIKMREEDEEDRLFEKRGQPTS